MKLTAGGTVWHSSGLVELAPTSISQGRRAGMRATEYATQVPTFLVGRDIDLGSALKYGRALGVTPTDVLTIASAKALVATPAAHACLIDGKPHTYLSTRVAVLVRSGDALIPLVFPDAENRSAVEVRSERSHLRELLKVKRLPADRMSAPTFVISNLGPYGVEWFSAVLYPQTAMTLAVGRMADADETASVHAVLTCDHRIVDGVDAAEFLDALAGAVGDVQITNGE